MTGLSAAAIDWAGARGISPKTLEAVGAKSGAVGMPGLGVVDVLALPYFHAGKLVNVKYRALSAKSFRMKTGGELRFYGDTGEQLSDEVYLVEGEFDRLAMIEAGISPTAVLSVPNGAPKAENENPWDMERYQFVSAAIEHSFRPNTRFILATDNDVPGRCLRNDLMRMFGIGRCAFVDWPDGCKDAGDFILAHGADALQPYLREAEETPPIPGVYRMSEIPEPPAMEIWRPGFAEWEKRLAFSPSLLSVVTGHPGMGKTHVMTQLWFQMARAYDFAVAFASFETRPRPHQLKTLRQSLLNRHQADLAGDEIAYADKLIDKHFRWIMHDASRPSLPWLLDIVEALATRDPQVRALVIDPWNKLESTRPEQVRETDWIGQCLDEIAIFARNLNLHVQILAHPAKMFDRRRGEAPELEDIAGSKHWHNKPDQGLCIHRPKLMEKTDETAKNETEVRLLKSRFAEELGQPTTLHLDYNPNKFAFEPADYKTRWD